MKKRAWYLSPWFICFLFALWPLIIPAVLGLILLIMYYQFEMKQNQNYAMIDDARNFVSDAETRQQELIEKVRQLEGEVVTRGDKARAAVAALNSELLDIKKEIAFYQSDLIIAASAIVVDETISSEEYKNKLSMLRLSQGELVKNNAAVLFSVPNVSAKDKKVVDTNIKQLLRCFNAECEIIVSNASVKTIDSCRNKINKVYEALNKLFSAEGLSLSSKILSMKLDELSLIYSFKLRQEQEKEEQRAIKEQMVEEDKVRREIEVQKAKIEKEESQFKNEISKLMTYLGKTENDLEKQLYIDKIKELEEKVVLLEKDKKNVLEREQNTRAGFVYIISNIGSFGEDVYKIGMTRRLEPMDRVKELGDASVPFEFDVHAMIFSEDAPKLETILHSTFKEKQINKVNTRKEFFKVDLGAVEAVVKQSHNATVTFTQFAKAEQYRASLAL